MRIAIRLLAVLFIILGSLYAYFIIDILNVYSALGWNIPTVVSSIPATALFSSAFFCAVVPVVEQRQVYENSEWQKSRSSVL